MPSPTSADLRIAVLSDAHDRNGFTCGVESLDRYLKTQAGQDVRRKANAVFVLSRDAEPDRVLGYYTLCAMAVSQGEVPEAARKHVPRLSARQLHPDRPAGGRQGPAGHAPWLDPACRRATASIRERQHGGLVRGDRRRAGRSGSRLLRGIWLSYGYQIRCALLCRCVKLAWDLNDDAFAVTKAVGKAPGKQIREGFELWGSKRTRNADMPHSEFTRSLEAADYDSFGAPPMPKVAASPLRHASCCFPPCFPGFPDLGGEAKNGPDGPF